MTKETIKDKVEALLKQDNQIGFLCRNNDNFLTLTYINTYHQDLNITFNEHTDVKDISFWAKDLPAISEIKRIRAYFQNNKGKYLAELKVLRNRLETEVIKREEYKK